LTGELFTETRTFSCNSRKFETIVSFSNSDVMLQKLASVCTLSDMPPFTLYDHNYSSDVAAVKKTQLALSKAVTLTLARKTMYRSMAEYLSHHQEEDYTSEPLF